MSEFQTLTFIKRELARRGLRPVKGLGQHFLIDGNLLQLMVEEAGVGEGDLVLEVGCGTGGLTALLAGAAGQVVAVELDDRLLSIAREALADFENVTFWAGDVLAGKHTLTPELVELVGGKLSGAGARRLKVVSDLPYKVAAPVIANLWESELPVELMLVTVQRELAERLVAKPGTKAYGGLTVKVAVRAEVEVLRILPASVFWPRPAVESAFVRLRRRPKPMILRTDYRAFSRLVDALFNHRRKTLSRALKLAAKEMGGGESAPVPLAPSGLAAQRVEQLTVADLIGLSQGFPRPGKTP